TRDQLIDSAVNAASAANADSSATPRNRTGVSGRPGASTAQANSAAPVSSRPISVHVVRTSCKPPCAPNAHRMIPRATPAASSTRGAGEGSKKAAAWSRRSGLRSGATYVLRRRATADMALDERRNRRERGRAEQDEHGDERVRQRVVPGRRDQA